jgi:DNA-cytosine methyltransferase
MNKLYNHYINKVSDLDMRMIVAIPEGGNWKNIPLDVPSKRLEGIRKTGGRTTLYGRLDRNKPAYTVNTYFTRPGNGTFIHPIHHRLISPREAARLQSFPDNYRFFGAKKHIATQIGNAVPPLLAYAVALEVKKQLTSVNTIDLFSGAGGMGLGFKECGFNIITANDVFKEAGITYKHNHPETPFIEGSIMEPNIKDEIIAIGKEKGVDVIIGGPPCQGFSLAGKQLSDDPRNFLYKEFVALVKQLSPKMFVMENVPGILSSNKGKTFESIKNEFATLGYEVEAKKLLACDYGVPQKRNRVFIVGLKGKSPLFNPKKLLEEGQYVTVNDALSDLYDTHPVLDKEESVLVQRFKNFSSNFEEIDCKINLNSLSTLEN